MAIKIKRSTGDLAPSALAAGQLAYTEGPNNGGTLYYGEISGTVREIGGRKYVDKLNGIEDGAQVNTVDSVNGLTGAVTFTAKDIGGEESSNKNQANGYAGLDGNGLIPSSLLPSYVDDVEEFADQNDFPSPGEQGKIYVAIDSSKIYRWSGSIYIEISASPGSTDSVTEGTVNLYYRDDRARSALSAEGDIGYDPLTGVISYTTPFIPTKVGELENDAGYISDSEIGGYFDGYLNVTSSINDLSDVNAPYSQLSPGDLLVWSGFGWVRGGADEVVDQGISSITIDQLADVDTAGVSDGHVLTYLAGSWISQAPAEVEEVITEFSQLSDTPTNYEGQGTSFVKVKPDQTGLEFVSGSDINLSSFNNNMGFISEDDFDELFKDSEIGDLSNVSIGAPGPGQILVFDGSSWVNQDQEEVVTEFTGLTDTPSTLAGSAGYFVRVNSAASALEFTQDIDDGTF